MPRVIVTTDRSQQRADAPVLLDEHVDSVHLSSDLAAAQLVERIAWAIGDAEHAERAGDTVSLQSGS
jgi:hypothetical protein